MPLARKFGWEMPESWLHAKRGVFKTDSQARGEGTHFLVPVLQRAILYDVRIKPRVRRFNTVGLWSDVQNISTTTGSKGRSSFDLVIRQRREGKRSETDNADMQMVSLTLRVMSRPDVNHLPKIYQNLGLE